MATLLSVSSKRARTVRTSTRVLFLLIGFSLIYMEMTFPPVKTLWMVSGFFLAAVLILFSIVGLSPRLRVSSFGKVLNNTMVHVVASLILGMGIIMAAMINPPVHIVWFAFFNFIGILLTFDAIITSSWKRLKVKRSETAGHSPKSKILPV